MECSCTVDSGFNGGEDMMEFGRSKIVRARKMHRCSECGCGILPGKQYEYSSGYWDGGFGAYKTCEDCISLRDEFFGDGWTYGMLWSDFKDQASSWGYDIPEKCILALTEKARDRVLQIVEDGLEHLERMGIVRG